MSATTAKTKTSTKTSSKKAEKGILDKYDLFYEELPEVKSQEPSKEDIRRLKRASKQ